MKGMKKMMAVALAATMVMGSSITVFAEDPKTSGGSNGVGTSEGHVDTHIISVTLPTVPDGSTPFAYTMDPERLIQKTGGTKYSSATFPAEADDTGVYFLTGANTYSNTSQVLTVSSESSADVILTVEVAVESAATDIELVDSKPTASTTDPELYLALLIGSETKVIKKGEIAIGKVTIAGKDGNFETTYASGAYAYTPKTGSDITWNTAEFSLTGAVSNASAEDLTAPTLKVTWKYADAADAAPSISKTSYYYTIGSDVNVKVNLGVGSLKATGVQKVTFDKNGTITDLPTTRWSYANGVITFNDSYTTAMNGQTRTHVITFNDEKHTTVEVTLAPEPDPYAPTISTTSYSYTAGTAVSIPVDLGYGDLAATLVQSIQFDKNGTATDLPTTRWSYKDGVITFTGDYTTAMNGQTRVHTVKFNDAAGTTVNVTLAPAN